MPAQAPTAMTLAATAHLQRIGERLRAQRKAMKVGAGAAAAAAGMSRQTFNRIERGEPSVTMGAYINALCALGLKLDIEAVAASAAPAVQDDDAIRVADYPQLKTLAWHLPGAAAGLRLPGAEALALYERNWRHVDKVAMRSDERRLLDTLVQRHGNGVLLV